MSDTIKLAKALHTIYHALDDYACEDAQTGVVTIEFPRFIWREILEALDDIGKDDFCHVRLHEILGE